MKSIILAVVICGGLLASCTSLYNPPPDSLYSYCLEHWGTDECVEMWDTSLLPTFTKE